MQLQTKRFLLRDFRQSDAPAFVGYHSDPRLRALYGPGENTPANATELIEQFMIWASETPRLNYQLAITLLDGTLIGCCGLRMREAAAGTAEFGIELAPDYWGRFGYALEPMAKLIDFGFRELGLEQVFGRTVSANARISRLAAVFGAIPTELDTPDWMSAKGWQQIQWQIDREQWLKRAPEKWL